MFIVHKKETVDDKNASLRSILKQVINENEIPVSSLADQLNINRRMFEKYLSEGGDLKFSQAISIMQFLNMEESDFIRAYKNDMTDEDDSSERSKRLAFLYKHFDIPTLKDVGVIKKRAKIDEIEDQLCAFLGLQQSIYEYEMFAVLPTLFSKSKRLIAEEKATKMTSFWLKCAIQTFKVINNPYEYNRELLIEFVKRIHEYTEDQIHGYEKVILILYRIGVTVLTQPYISKTGSFGVTMLMDNKPCIVITDMKKKYHKLWMSLIHELYHVINDYNMLQSSYHISAGDEQDILFNEEKADLFALNVLIPEEIRIRLSSIVRFPIKVRMLASQIAVDPSIIYGIYLESLPKEQQINEFKKYGGQNCLFSSDIAIRNVQFDPIGYQNLNKAIEYIRNNLYNKQII
ncbi:MAG: hypothetical protein LBN24_09505 [Mediterranea sp.]|jgi:Zn-dependent peptidase ImmA (M78 family)|nr:hypothetical protein [Mediterranea sp.]